MSVNSTSVSNISSRSCLLSRENIAVASAYALTKIPFLPLFAYVFYLGCQRWRRERSSASMSHADLITYHMNLIEIIGIVGFIVFTCGGYVNDLWMMSIGGYIGCMIFPGQIVLHILTCVERYLAVVHPTTYMVLRKVGGVKVRNISIGCAWLLIFGYQGLMALYHPDLPMIPFLCILICSFTVMSFCSISVLRVLKRPGPSEVGGNVGRVDQTKQRAFYTIMTITGLLTFWCAGIFVHTLMATFDLFGMKCLFMVSSIWYSLPNSLVLPLLYLHRAEKLLCHC